jgi:hypothetical protein
MAYEYGSPMWRVEQKPYPMSKCTVMEMARQKIGQPEFEIMTGLDTIILYSLIFTWP